MVNFMRSLGYVSTMEFKKLGGNSFYKALHQITIAVKGKLDEETIADPLTIYLVVDLLLWGLKSPFGKWISKRSMIVNLNKMFFFLWGCRFLLQSGAKYNKIYEYEEPPYLISMNNIPT